MKYKFCKISWILFFCNLFNGSCRFEEVEPLYADFLILEGEKKAMVPLIFQDASVGAVSWYWEFGNGNQSTNQTPPEQTYPLEGTYTVSLKVKNKSGIEDVKSVRINVATPPPVVAAFDMPSNGKLNDSIVFANKSIFGTTYRWDFGLGINTSSEKNPIVVFNSIGGRTIKLIAMNSSGQDSISKQLEVCDTPLAVINTTGNQNVFSLNFGISFSSENSIINGTDSLVSYFWDFGDGQFSNDKNPTHIYQLPGDYQVLLRLTNPCGENWSLPKVISIFGPQACFTVSDTTCVAPCQITFTNCSSNAVGFEWDFGDGTYSQLVVPSPKTYSIPGTYQIQLKAKNGNANQTVNKSIVVSDGPAQCEAYIGPGPNDKKIFMCHNLGVANPTADPFEPSWRINGGYWQWGRKEQASAGPTGPFGAQASAGAVAGWITTSALNGALLDDSKTANDPCPPGFRVPTRSQWIGVIYNNTITTVGTWTQSSTNYSSGKKFGDKLFLPAAGSRDFQFGYLNSRGDFGQYLSSTEFNFEEAWCLYFFNSSAGISADSRTSGYSVRCISD
jgi:uncharacterized protein (TIGR02145 family)